MNVPYVDNEAIWRAAGDFRTSAELAGNDMPPIDVLYIVDVALRFDVIDIPNLFADIRMDAADPSWHEIEGMRTHVAKHMAPRFGVNYQVIETRFAHERIWPLE